MAQDKYVNKAKIIRLVKAKEVTNLLEIFDTEEYLANFSYLLIKNNNACLLNQTISKISLLCDFNCFDAMKSANNISSTQ